MLSFIPLNLPLQPALPQKEVVAAPTVVKTVLAAAAVIGEPILYPPGAKEDDDVGVGELSLHAIKESDEASADELSSDDENNEDEARLNPLTKAVLHHDIEALRKNAHLGIDQADELGWTPLTLAVSLQETELVRFLIQELHANPNQRDKNGCLPLVVAALKHNLSLANELVDLGAKTALLEESNKAGFTPLTSAVDDSDEGTAMVLAQVGVNIDALDANGFSPLGMAVSQKNHKMARFLGLLGVNPKQVVGKVTTPLVNALLNQDKKMVTILVKELGVDPNLPDPAIGLPLFALLWQGDNDMITFFKTLGADSDLAKEVLRRKELAHVWGIEGTTTLKRADGKEVTFSLEAINRQAVPQFLTKFFPAFVDDSLEFTAAQKAEINKVIDTPIFPGDFPNENVELLANAKKNEPVIFINGSDGHCVTFVLTKNRLYICNRGESQNGEFGVVAYEVTDQQLTLDLIAKLRGFHKTMDELNAMVKDLGLKKLNAESVKMKGQKVGNCTWSSATKGAICALMMHYKKPYSLYKSFSAFARGSALYDYIKESAAPDLKLLNDVGAKILAKANANQKNYQDDVFRTVGLLIAIGEKTGRDFVKELR